jgi:hypothetical protein
MLPESTNLSASLISYRATFTLEEPLFMVSIRMGYSLRIDVRGLWAKQVHSD